jgi:N-methylhydantoinase A
MSRYRVSMDIGGTFTDVVAYDEQTGTYAAGKSSTTPADLTEGVLAGLEQVVGSPSDIGFTVHGTTQGLNAFLQRKGERVLLLATEGAGDVYHIARGNRTRLYDIHFRKPEPLLPRADIVEIPGRLDYAGAELEALDEGAIRAAAGRARDEGFGSVAVAFLFSYVNPDQELRAEAILREELGDGVAISLSHRVAREWREYERTSSAVIDAYTAPIVRRYLERLESELKDRGLAVPLHVMQSSGGIVTAESARRLTLQTLLSGPVGCTMGGVALARLLDRPNLICIDMGGTSFDVSLVVDGKPDVSSEAELEGFPLMMSVVNIHTIGAGGGSLAYAEAGGLRVGPQSAGADPGPACYGRGGTEPTVTDANLVLGHLDVDRPLAGGVRLDAAAAQRAVAGLADELGLADARACAEGIVRVANTEMVRALRVVTVERGIDPRRFALLAFGGAGPLHAAAIAEELGIGRIVVPRAAGVLSALGLAAAERRHDTARSVLLRGAALTDDALRELAAGADEVTWDARYVGQSHELSLRDVGPRAADLREAFAAAHDERYGYRDDDADIELVTVRTARVEAGPEVRWEVGDAGRHDDVVGPAVVHLPEATLVVAAGWRGSTDATGTVILHREAT